MRTWRLSLQAADGTTVAPARAALRYAAWWIGPALAVAAAGAFRGFAQPVWVLPLLGINYAWALFDPGRLFLHDRLAGTSLVTVGLRSQAREPDAVSR